jgi:hypothetical protein
MLFLDWSAGSIPASATKKKGETLMNEERIVLSGEMKSSRTKFRHVNIKLNENREQPIFMKIRKFLKKCKK